MNVRNAVRSGAVCLAVASVIALGALGCSARRSEQARQEGDTYLNIGKVAEAQEAYDRALKANPENALAMMGQGRALLRQKKTAEALEAYRKAVAADPKLEAAYVEAASILMAENKAPVAEALAQELQKADPEAGDVLLASIYAKTGKTDQAVTLLEKSRDRSPQSVRARVALAKAYLTNKQIDKAETELKEVLKSGQGEETLQARMALVDVYHAQGKLDQMVNELRTLVAERPNDLALQLVLARSLLEAGQVEEAQKITEPVLAEVPDSPWANYIIGSCYLAKKSYADAVPYLETAAQALPNQPIIEQQLALAKSGGKAQPAAPAPATQTATAPGAPAAPAGPTAETAAWEDLWKSASLNTLLDQRERFLADNPDNPLLRETLLLAAMFAGRTPLMQPLLEQVPADSPVRAYVQALQAKDFPGALKALEPWKTADPARQVLERNAAAFAYGMAGARFQALVTFSEGGRLDPENVVFLLNLGVMYRAAQMPEFAAGALRKLLSRYPENIAARQLLFQVYLDQDKIEEAQGVAESSYGLFPDRREPIVSLAQVYVLNGNAGLAAEALSRGLQTLPDDPALLVALAGVRLHEAKPDEAMQIAEKITAPEMEPAKLRVLAFAFGQKRNWAGIEQLLNGKDPAQLAVPVRLLQAAAVAAAGRAADAANLLAQEERIAKNPRVAVLLQALGQSSDAVPARAANLVSALTGQPEAQALYAYALACVDGGYAQQAYQALGELAERVGDQAYLVEGRLAALAKVRSGVDNAAEAQALVDKHADMPEAWVGLSEVRQAAKDAAGAREALDKALALAPDNPDVWMRAAQYAEWQKDKELALKAYQRLTELAPQEPIFHNNLAYYLIEANGNAEQALSEAKQAAEKLKSNPNVLHTLGLAYLKTGNVEEAHKNLELALQMRPGDPTLMLDYGQVLVAMNRQEDGQNQARMALQTSELLQLDFPRRDEAQKLAGVEAPVVEAPAAPAQPASTSS